jgi:TIR domain
MTFNRDPSVKIFISHASEDGDLAKTFAKTLRTLHDDRVDIVRMGEFQTGTDWYEEILKSATQADVLVALATGQLKPSHSFTGLEIGCFLTSVRETGKMRTRPELDRRLVPVAIGADIPTTITHLQGVSVQIEKNEIVRDIGHYQTSEAVDSMFDFLCDVEDIVKRNKKGTARTTLQSERSDLLKKTSRQLLGDVLQLAIEKIGKLPRNPPETTKAKLIITSREKISTSSIGDLEGLTLRVEGSNFDEVFGVTYDVSGPPLSWSQFTTRAEARVALQWRRALLALTSEPDSPDFINNNYILSFDGKQVFRVFLSKKNEYLDGSWEYQIYFLKLLREKEYGEGFLAQLVRALEVGIGYRVLFFSSMAPFAPKVLVATNREGFAEKIQN